MALNRRPLRQPPGVCVAPKTLSYGFGMFVDGVMAAFGFGILDDGVIAAFGFGMFVDGVMAARNDEFAA